MKQENFMKEDCLPAVVSSVIQAAFEICDSLLGHVVQILGCLIPDNCM